MSNGSQREQFRKSGELLVEWLSSIQINWIQVNQTFENSKQKTRSEYKCVGLFQFQFVGRIWGEIFSGWSLSDWSTNFCQVTSTLFKVSRNFSIGVRNCGCNQVSLVLFGSKMPKKITSVVRVKSVKKKKENKKKPNSPSMLNKVKSVSTWAKGSNAGPNPGIINLEVYLKIFLLFTSDMKAIFTGKKKLF